MGLTRDLVGRVNILYPELHCWTLSFNSSILIVELYVIWQSFRFCDTCHNRKSFLIFSNSLEVLKLLQNLYSIDTFVEPDLSYILYLNNTTKNSFKDFEHISMCVIQFFRSTVIVT